MFRTVCDRLAAKAGISGYEIRRRNVISPGAIWGPGQVMDDGCLGALRCLDAVKPAYDEAVAAGKAVGVSLGLKNSGLGNGFKEVAKAVHLPDVKQRFEAEGATPAGTSPSEFAAFYRAEAEKWADVAKRSGTRLD